MNPIIKGKWIGEIRGTKYRQGKNYLRQKDRYCCLGVLCDIMDNSKWEISSKVNNRYSYGNYTDVLDYRIRKQAGISFLQMLLLMKMNDSGKTFEEIAKVIETQF